MRKLSRILVYELKTTLLRRSFLVITFGIPLVLLALFGVRYLAIRDDKPKEPPAQSELKTEGYVDQAGLVRQLPEDLPAGILRPFPDEGAAREAMWAGDIQAYYVIPANYLSNGELVYIRQEYSPLASEGMQDWMMRWTLLYNLLDGNMQLAGRVWTPAVVTENNLSAKQSGFAEDCPVPGYTCESSILLRYLPLIILVVFMITILTTSSTLLQNMSKEKENRLLEVLLNAASPGQLMAGKILGLGILGLLQVTLWLGTVYIIVNNGQAALSLPPGFSIPPSFLAWGFAFFLLGYALYAFIMAGAGAMIPDVKSYASTAFIVASPLYLGYLATIFSSFDPNGPLMVTLSLIPFTSPIVMPWRMVHGAVPAWQPWLATGLLVISVYLMARAVSRMFRAQMLLSGQPFRIQRYLKMLVSPEATI